MMGIGEIRGPGGGDGNDGFGRSSEKKEKDRTTSKVEGAWKGKEPVGEATAQKGVKGFYVNKKTPRDLEAEIMRASKRSSEYKKNEYFQGDIIRDALVEYHKIPINERPDSLRQLVRGLSHHLLYEEFKTMYNGRDGIQSVCILRPCSTIKDPEGFKLLAVDYIEIRYDKSVSELPISKSYFGSTLIAFGRKNGKWYKAAVQIRKGRQACFLTEEHETLEGLLRNTKGCRDPKPPTKKVEVSKYMQQTYLAPSKSKEDKRDSITSNKCLDDIIYDEIFHPEKDDSD